MFSETSVGSVTPLTLVSLMMDLSAMSLTADSDQSRLEETFVDERSAIPAKRAAEAGRKDIRHDCSFI